ncbi:SWIM zinc finger family protein [Streptomyces sp. NPDC002514]|uniref:SWIM zinc finger family protein n=1 Tax=Streptomyces sp. NPDC001270 TaxID=3364554 RepID=UPI0036749CFB
MRWDPEAGFPRGTERDAGEGLPRGTASGGHEAPPAADAEGDDPPVRRSRPGDAARAALRSAAIAGRVGRGARRTAPDSAALGPAARLEVGPDGPRPRTDDTSANASNAPAIASDNAAGAPADRAAPQAAPPADGAATTTAPTDARPGAGSGSGSRPGDVAREALRAACRKAERTGEERRSVTPPRAAHRAPAPRGTGAAASGTTSGVPSAGAGAGAGVAPGGASRDVRQLLADALRRPPSAVAAARTEPVARAVTRPGSHSDADTDADADTEWVTTPADQGAWPWQHRAAQAGPHPDAHAGLRPEVRTDSHPEVQPDVRTDSRPAVQGGRRSDARVGRTPHTPAVPRRAASGTGPDHEGPPADSLDSDSDSSSGSGSGSGSVPSRGPWTMGAPHRDGELRRTFPPFPGRSATGGAEKPFAATWWGNAWVSALEQSALDTKRLARGRGYAEQGQVDAITVTPGLVLAYVRGSRPRPYLVQVRLRTFDDADWERFLDVAAERPGRIAALLDRQLPESLADSGATLLPGPGDLDPRCNCPDSGHPCKHAAALCYQTARLLDADPFVLLLLRGRGERRLLDALSRRSATAEARAAQHRRPEPLPGVRAAEALAARELPPLPAPLPPPAHPEQPPVYPAAPGGPDPFALDQLATDAAARAHVLLSTGRDPVGELTLWQDAVRLAAARPGSGLTAATRALYSSLAAAADRTPADLARAVAAWRQGGPDGLAVLEEPWDPPAGRFDRARPLLLAADLPAFRPWRNHLTHPRGHVQLRLGRDGLWYAYESEPGREDWWPRGTSDPDPVGALTGLDTLGDG